MTAGPLAGKVAVVTGAAQGTGKAIALRLARDGADVAVNDLDSERAAGTASEIRDLGRMAVVVPADVRDVEACAALVSTTVSELGGLDALVNNAGIMRPADFGDISVEDWDATIEVNARSVMMVSQAAAEVLRPGGCIVNVASVAARGTPTFSPAYAASKAAIVNITHTTARALAPRGLRVNAVCPGVIDTRMNHVLDEVVGVGRRGMRPGEFLAQRIAGVPIGRIGTPEDVAGVVAFLAGPDAAYITGQSINVDGGLVVS